MRAQEVRGAWGASQETSKYTGIRLERKPVLFGCSETAKPVAVVSEAGDAGRVVIADPDLTVDTGVKLQALYGSGT
jgi:hypothetical protein